jgi:hypothetical protein
MNKHNVAAFCVKKSNGCFGALFDSLGFNGHTRVSLKFDMF